LEGEASGFDERELLYKLVDQFERKRLQWVESGRS
jgi:hypothetical protein